MVLADPDVRRHPNALALAGHIMHRFMVEKGYAEVSIASAVKALSANERSIERAFAYLQRRGWIQLKEAYSRQRPGWNANRYSLAFGPQDFDPTMHATTHKDNTDADVGVTNDGDTGDGLPV